MGRSPRSTQAESDIDSAYWSIMKEYSQPEFSDEVKVKVAVAAEQVLRNIEENASINSVHKTILQVYKSLHAGVVFEWESKVWPKKAEDTETEPQQECVSPPATKLSMSLIITNFNTEAASTESGCGLAGAVEKSSELVLELVGDPQATSVCSGLAGADPEAASFYTQPGTEAPWPDFAATEQTIVFAGAASPKNTALTKTQRRFRVPGTQSKKPAPPSRTESSPPQKKHRDPNYSSRMPRAPAPADYMTSIEHHETPLSYAEYQAGKLADMVANMRLQNESGAPRGACSGESHSGTLDEGKKRGRGEQARGSSDDGDEDTMDTREE